jgi:cytochrome bd ubiquinol oxidase subunit II
METLWFGLVAVMVTMYVVFDGFDLGAGALHFLVARDETERKMVIRSIGPVWDGNEVWLLAAGGALFLAFPALYASSFSGFYLPLMIVLWLLILRGISIEFRSHVKHPAWVPFWDVVFSFASALLAVFYGAALGNVVRGVPLDESGYFFSALWTHFRPAAGAGILDWYTVLVGLAALAALAMHGALWLHLKCTGDVGSRSPALARRAWWAAVVMTAVITFFTFRLQPQVPANMAAMPWGWIFPALAVSGLAGVLVFLGRNEPLKAFLSSCLYLVGMMTSAAFGLYPYVLPAVGDPALGLTAQSAATSPYAMRVALAWFIPGMILVTAYFVYVYRSFAGKVRMEGEGY